MRSKKMWTLRRRIVTILITSLLFPGAYLAQAKPKEKEKSERVANLSLVHAIPLGFGADIVDIYVNDTLTVDNAVPGSIKSFTVPKGSFKVKFYANGVTPASTTPPLLASNAIYLGTGVDISFVAHLSEDEKAKLSIFKNMVTSAGSKRSWITLRHVAAAPAMQFRVNGERAFVPLMNSDERKRSFLLKSYSVTATLPETATVIAGPSILSLVRDTNTVVYLWGAKSKGNLALLKQETPARRD